MDETAKQTNIFGEVLKTNLAAYFIKVGIQKIIDGFKKIKEAVISYVNTGIEISNAETENRQKLLQVMQNTMDARLEDAESIEALISSQEKLGVVSKLLSFSKIVFTVLIKLTLFKQCLSFIQSPSIIKWKNEPEVFMFSLINP